MAANASAAGGGGAGGGLAEGVGKQEFIGQFKFTHFSETWGTQGGTGVLSRVVQVGGADFQVVLKRSGESEAAPVISLFLKRVDNAINPVLTMLDISMKRPNSSVIRCVFRKPAWYVAPWATSLSEHHVTSRGWATFCCEADLLAHAEHNGDTADLDVKITTEYPNGVAPRDTSTCLAGVCDTMAWVRGAHDQVTITAADGFQLRVARSLLCTHSGVLRAAFASGMAEEASDSVDMPDVRREALEMFISCLYRGGLPASLVGPWTKVVSVLILADKYGVDGLADACVWCLSVCLSKQNAAMMLKLADENGLVKLRQAAVNFATSHIKRAEAIMNSDEYASLSADLLRELTAHWMRLAQAAASSKEELDVVPPFLQWGSLTRELEFRDQTDWQKQHANDLRRACFERGLATAGTPGELIARLAKRREASPDDVDGQRALASKRKRATNSPD